jgi:hypothetical protein
MVLEMPRQAVVPHAEDFTTCWALGSLARGLDMSRALPPSPEAYVACATAPLSPGAD